MRLTLHIWRQKGPTDRGGLKTYTLNDVDSHMSFLEMLDVLNQDLIARGEQPIAFDHDCREGICGMCGAVVNGRPNGPVKATTLCEVHVRHFKDGETVVIEPWRARAFPIIRDLVVDRGALDKLIQAGGYISVNTGSAPEANAAPVPPLNADLAMDAAACIGCGACVAACPNASAMLFVSAKVSQLALLPQGKPEAAQRAISMVRAMDDLLFGNCSNHRSCEAVCPKEISITNIARLNREYIKAGIFSSVK